jgi:hypothetical protein
VVYRLPKVIPTVGGDRGGHTTLPPVALPTLTEALHVEYDDHLDWLQGFRGTGTRKIGAFLRTAPIPIELETSLERLQSVMLTTSTQNTLSGIQVLHVHGSWNPNYYTLLSFKQLKAARLSSLAVAVVLFFEGR